MPNADELRDLIQQVEDRGGPLAVWGDPDECQVVVSEGSIHMRLTSPFDLDGLAGVLRRSLNEAGLGVTHDADAGQLGGTVHHTVIVYGEHEEVARTSDDSTLVAHLEAWLEAYEAGSAALDEPEAGPVGRQEATDGA